MATVINASITLMANVPAFNPRIGGSSPSGGVILENKVKIFSSASCADGRIMIEEDNRGKLYLTIEEATNLTKTLLKAIRIEMNKNIDAINSLEPEIKDSAKIQKISNRFVDILTEGE